jgi:hypothetical protein
MWHDWGQEKCVYGFGEETCRKAATLDDLVITKGKILGLILDK